MANIRLINIYTIGVLFFAMEVAARRTSKEVPKVHGRHQERQSQRQMKKLKCKLPKHMDMNLLFTDEYYLRQSWYDDCRKYWLTHGPTTSHAPTLSSPPTQKPSQVPSLSPTISRPPTQDPSQPPSSFPTISKQPTQEPSQAPSSLPTLSRPPTQQPTQSPSLIPTLAPTDIPSPIPTDKPTLQPSSPPTKVPSSNPSTEPTQGPSFTPSYVPTSHHSVLPSALPSLQPTDEPTSPPSSTALPSIYPIGTPSIIPSVEASEAPSEALSAAPSVHPAHKGSLFYNIGIYVITFEVEGNSRKLSLRSGNRDGEYVNEAALELALFTALSDKYKDKIPFFDYLDLEVHHERTVKNSRSAHDVTKVSYSFTGFAVLNTSSWNGHIDATQIPNKQKLAEMTIDAFVYLKKDISHIFLNAGVSLEDLTIRSIGEVPETSGGSKNTNTTEFENISSTWALTITASMVAVVATVSAVGLLYRQAKMTEAEAEIDTPQKKMDVGQDDSMAIKSSARKFRSPFMNVSPPDGTKKYFSKLDDDSVYSKKYGKAVNSNQSLVDSSFDESSYADSLQAPSLVSSRMGGGYGQSDVESLAGMSALDHVRLNSVLQIEEEGEAHDDRSMVSTDTGVFRRIWYGNKRNRITRSAKKGSGGSIGSSGKRMGSTNGNGNENSGGSSTMLKLSPPSRDTPTKKSPTKSFSTRKSPTKSSPMVSSSSSSRSKKPQSKSQSQSPYNSASKSLFADKNEKDDSGIDDASLLGDQSTKSEYYRQDDQDEKLFYSMLGERADPNRSGSASGSASVSYDENDDSSEDINFTEMYNGDVSCYSENTSDMDSNMSRVSTSNKLASVTGSLMVGEYDA